MAFSPSMLSSQAYRTSLIASTWLCVLLAGCKDRHEAPGGQGTAAATSARATVAVSSPKPPAPKPAASRPRPVRARSSAPASASAVASESAATAEPFDLGTPAPVALANQFMVAKDKKDDLIIARPEGGRPSPIRAAHDQVSPWPVALAPGEPIHAYWVSRGRLVRREVKADGAQGPLEVLASDASNVAPVSASRSSGPVERDVVLYVGSRMTSERERQARLWVEGQGSRPLSREAGGATSVSVVALGAGRFALLVLDGRVGMSPVHAVSLELDAKGAPHLGEDRVVHVAGPAERGTALTGVQLGRGPVALLPISKDSLSFGLLALRVGYGDGEAPSSWVDYPNGLDPAPVAAARPCDKPMVAFVRPENKAPGSPRVLELARLDRDGTIQDRRVIASAPSIPHIAFEGRSDGGWLVWATERGLRGHRVECK